jgi:hypothetical protein
MLLKSQQINKNESNVSVTEFEGVMHVRQGNKYSSGVRPHYGVNKLTHRSIYFIIK